MLQFFNKGLLDYNYSGSNLGGWWMLLGCGLTLAIVMLVLNEPLKKPIILGEKLPTSLVVLPATVSFYTTMLLGGVTNRCFDGCCKSWLFITSGTLPICDNGGSLDICNRLLIRSTTDSRLGLQSHFLGQGSLTFD
ncbi:hypothetical protein U1Q18_018496 [Sarracenia purpurea var. burkii]